MKTSIFKKEASMLLAVVVCLSTFAGLGTTAVAAGETAEAIMISFPRDGDSNYGGTWGHGKLVYMNGWTAGATEYTTVYAVDSYTGNIC